MKFEEFGMENDTVIVMLHGANFVHTFGRCYCVSKFFHIVVPHIMGFGAEAHRTFDADTCILELAEFIKSFNKKVYIIGHSLGAQLAFALVSKYPELFLGALIISPHLIKSETELADLTEKNLKQLKTLKNKAVCRSIAFLSGMPKKARREFVEHIQNISEQTVINCINNNITFESMPDFKNISLPIIALAGTKEPSAIKKSVVSMTEINSNCTLKIWKNAAHNIPSRFSSKLISLLLVTVPF